MKNSIKLDLKNLNLIFTQNQVIRRMVRNFSVIEPSVRRWDPDPTVNIFGILVSLIVLIGNGTLLLFIFTSKIKVMKPNMFILSLTLSDFMIALIEGPMINYVSFFDVSQYFCEIYINFGQGLARISSMTIMIISIDRYLKLRYPIKYKAEWSGTRRRVTVALLLWLFSYSLSAARMIDSILYSGNYTKGCFHRESFTLFEQVEMMVTVMGSNIIALVYYIKILLLVRDSRRQVLAGLIVVQDTNNPSLEDMVPAIQYPIVSPPKYIRKHLGHYVAEDVEIKYRSWKPSVILGLVVVFNLLFVSLPPFLYSVYLICQSCRNESIFHSLPAIFMCSSAVNPIIFALLNTDFRSFITSCCTRRESKKWNSK